MGRVEAAAALTIPRANVIIGLTSIREKRLAITQVALALLLLLPGSLSPANAAQADTPLLLKYQWDTSRSLRYKVRADIKGNLPLFDSPEPIPLEANLVFTYVLTASKPNANGQTVLTFRVESADAEVQKIPFAIPEDQASRALNQRVTVRSSGEVVEVAPTEPLPFSLSLPGIDPKRLYALLIPVVFPTQPVRPSTSWNYRSELIGSDMAEPRFEAALESVDSASKSARVVQNLQLVVDQKLGPERKPLKEGEQPAMARSGRVDGKGAYRFSLATGGLLGGYVNLNANLVEEPLGEPKPEGPKRVESTVEARITIQLLNASASTPVKPAAKTAKTAPKKKKGR